MAHKEGKKGRKVGRSSRKPSHNRYNAERRWETNKARKQTKIAKMLVKKKARSDKKAQKKTE